MARKAIDEMGEDKAAAIMKFMPFSPELARPICGTHWDAQKTAATPQADTFLLTPAPNVQFRIVPRSAYGVFKFLGNLMKVEQQNLPPSDKAFVPLWKKSFETAPPQLLTTDDQDLIRVEQKSGPTCFSHTWFFDGDYCVPEDATNTKRIVSLLAQFIAIETTATDLTITPVVRVIQ